MLPINVNFWLVDCEEMGRKARNTQKQQSRMRKRLLDEEITKLEEAIKETTPAAGVCKFYSFIILITNLFMIRQILC